MRKTSLSEKQFLELNRVKHNSPGLYKQGKLGEFLDLWLVCEVLAKKHIVYHKKLSELPERWSYPELMAALKHFEISFEDGKVKDTFKSGSDRKRGNKTARQLRNGYLHSLSSPDRHEIEHRISILRRGLKYWIRILSGSI